MECLPQNNKMPKLRNRGYNKIMSKNKLYIYLEKEWRFNNHKKYHKYFEQWLNNLTDNQIHYMTNLWMNKKLCV